MITISYVNRRHGEDPRPKVQTLIRRMNQFERSISYAIDNNRLTYSIQHDPHFQRSAFAQSMIDYIDDTNRVPLRFVSLSSGEFIDSYYLATVDVDDVLGGSDHSMKLNLLHILEERFQSRNYNTQRPMARFPRAHRRAVVRERNYLREYLGDPTITYTGERSRGSSRYVFTFRSRRGYRLEHLFETRDGHVFSEVYVIEDRGQSATALIEPVGRRMSLEEFYMFGGGLEVSGRVNYRHQLFQNLGNDQTFQPKMGVMQLVGSVAPRQSLSRLVTSARIR